jgi:hemin uptake protein HemP
MAVLLSAVPSPSDGPRGPVHDAFVRRDTSPVHDARDLTGPDGQARILLDGRPYVLRITRAGKLILTR